MKHRLQGIAVLLMAILMTLAFGEKPFFDLDMEWSVLFCACGLFGLLLTWMPDRKDGE